MTKDTTHTTDDITDTEIDEYLELVGMAGLLKLRLDTFKANLIDDRHALDLVHSVALRYRKGDPAAAAIYLPTLIDQAHWLGLFKNPMALPISSPSISISSSSALAH
jgi:hypothetical protein